MKEERWEALGKILDPSVQRFAQTEKVGASLVLQRFPELACGAA